MNRIVKPVEQEYDQLIVIWEKAVRATHDFLKEEDILALRPLIRQDFFYKVDLYAVKDDRSIGYVGFAGMNEEKIEMLFVDPEVHGAGIGKRLIAYLLENCGAEKVDVNEQNLNALGFYLHLGFRITGRDEKDGMGKPYPLLHLEYLKPV